MFKEVFEIKNQIITLTDFYNNPLRALQKSIDDETFYAVIKEGNFNLINTFNEKYVSEEGLEINFFITMERYTCFHMENINLEDTSCI
jgi:hypothetical protein